MRKLSIFVGTCCLCLLLLGQTRPTTRPGGLSDTVVTEPRIQDLKGMNFLHATQQTTIRKMSTTITADVQKLEAAMKAHSISPVGPCVLIMKGLMGNPDQPFTLEFGFDVAKGSAAPEGYEITELPVNHCAGVIFSGPMANIGMAYQHLYSTIFGMGMMPMPESREYVLYWEGDGSANNVFMITVGIP